MRFYWIIVLATLISAADGLEWYESSPSGVPKSPIADLPAEGWALSIEDAEDAEIQTLYLDGVKKSFHVLLRRDGRLLGREEFDAEGNLIRKIEYAYDVDGRPRAIYYSEGAETEPHVISDIALTIDHENRRHLEGFEESWRITDMSSDGRQSTLSILDSGKKIGETNWIRDSEGNLEEEIIVRGTEERRIRYDSEARMINEEILKNGVPIMLRSYIWEGDKLVRVEERGSGVVKVKIFVWLEDRIVEETSTIDGIISARLIWRNQNEKIETLYKDGEPLVRVHWRDGRKYKEEFIGDQKIRQDRGL